MWQEFLTWIVPGLAVGTALWNIFMALRKNVVKPEDLARYATINDMLAGDKIVQDQVEEQQRGLANAGHHIEILRKDVENLPTHKTVQELRDDIGELKTGQAETKATLSGIDRTVSRIDDFLRTNK